MEFGRLLAKMRKKRRSEAITPPGPKGLEVHFYRPDGLQQVQLVKVKGCFQAEDLCTECAKRFGISPLCHSLYALCDEDKRIWYPPNYTFKAEDTSVRLHYRLRFYFTNWHGTHQSLQGVWRYGLKSTGPEGTPLLDFASLAYLFAQVQSDFRRGWAPVRPGRDTEDSYDIQNECLGMAVLAITHEALEQDQPVAGPHVGRRRYKRHIPESLNQTIRQCNILTRVRISNIFNKFLSAFNDKTVKVRGVSLDDLKIKYISTLETLTQDFGCELFEPVSLKLFDSEACGQPAQNQLLVSGMLGIRWRLKPSEDSALNLKAKPKKRTPDRGGKPVNASDAQSWTTICNFSEITNIVVRKSVVTIHKQDNKQMILDLEKHEKALSFTTLVDGYFRLTVDAHHFLCGDVAPPSVERNIREGCHGPISTDYAVHKLRQEGNTEGLYLLRASSSDYDQILLTVICNELDQFGLAETTTIKNFLVEKNPEGSEDAPGAYHLCGTDISCDSLRELMEELLGHCLRSDRVTLRLSLACPPQPREISNLLVATRGKVEASNPHGGFVRIRKENLIQKDHMGRGTRTNIYAGVLKLWSEDDYVEDDSDTEELQVVLKVLGAGQQDISPYLEMVSMMHRVSHKHITLLYGLCLRNQEIIMVEEFLQHGPLDVFMRVNHSSLCPSWKFQVAKQLASALSYLEDKKLVHGFVCTKNILLARPGMSDGVPFIKLSDPGVPSSMLNRAECVDRIPWIAPECVENQQVMGVAADKWGFGVTLWEICHDGEAPLRDKTLIEKECFYKTRTALVTPESSELADLMTQCMNYDPRTRPFFRAIVRDLVKIEEQNPQMVPDVMPTVEIDPTLFEKRFLRKIRELGEGYFGKVELCLYDPRGDRTGELVAVKFLKSENDSMQNSNLKREIDTMRELFHENIVKYKGVCHEEGGRTIKLIMEYLPLGSLKDYLPRNKAQISMKRLLLYALQICQGMDYLGAHNYIHRDLAARNVLVENENLVKIGDFGLTKSIEDNDGYYTVKEEQASPVYWYAPECLVHCKFYRASDVWSFGVTLYELMTYCETKSSPPEKFKEIIGPGHGQMTVTRLVTALDHGQRLPCPPDCPEMIYQQMSRCWESHPEKRITFQSLIDVFQELLSHADI
ncbi:tyrosine-protein kinase JAK1-like [Denticeps clupeoides]|uniref:tyrosine-protein kinase JAK1-like n=1 Tax=Denticeps clupeoides TaxID=299321 RepID=UPI0010A351B5|nr:tyrosine-protein kinase JAK1-like [Denticeps clupeoides]